MVKVINIKNVYPTANTWLEHKTRGLVTRGLEYKTQDSWSRIQDSWLEHANLLARRCGILSEHKEPDHRHQVWSSSASVKKAPPTKARDTEFGEMAAIRDFRLSTNQNIIIRSRQSQLVQIGIRPQKCWNRGPEQLQVRNWTWI